MECTDRANKLDPENYRPARCALYPDDGPGPADCFWPYV